MFDTISEPPLRLAASVGLTAIGLSAAMALQVVAMRWRALREARRMRTLVAKWRPLLVRTALGESCELPALPKRERRPLLLLWNQMQESVRGDAHTRLNQLGYRLGLRELARRMARSPRLASRVMGHCALGHFARASDRQLLERAMAELHMPSSLVAARALIRIDAAAAAPLVLQRYLAHDDWPAPRMGTLLREAPLDAFGAEFARRLHEGSLFEQLRLLPLLRFAEVPNVNSLIDGLVRSSNHPQVLSAVLRMLNGPASLPQVRQLALHNDPLVRSAAAQALGRVGGDADVDLLVELMSDPNWWVRYRAAQSLVGLPRMGAIDVVQLRRTLADRYARDMLGHVLAEREQQLPARAA